MRSRVDNRQRANNARSFFASKKSGLPAIEHRTGSMGLLVLVTGATTSGTDLVLAAARRRYLTDPTLEFPSRIATKNNEQDSEHIGVARRVFHDIAAREGFIVAWNHENISYGFTTGSFEALETGRIVVLAVPQEAVVLFKNVWSKIEIIPIGSDVDQARPQSKVWRSSSFPTCPSPYVSHSRDLAQALRNLLERLDDLRKEHLAACL